MENLHDKWAVSDWHQLWADDHRAFVLLPVENSDKYLVVIDDKEVVTAIEMDNFSVAIDEWNAQINDYLGSK